MRPPILTHSEILSANSHLAVDTPGHYPRELFRTVSSRVDTHLDIVIAKRESTCTFDAMTRRCVTSGLRRANKQPGQWGTAWCNYEKPAKTAGTHCGTLPLLSALSIPSPADGGGCWVFFRGIYDTRSPRWHFHRTADPTMDHSTRERANHSYANGLSRQVQGQPPPPERVSAASRDSRTWHVYTRKNIYADRRTQRRGQNRASLRAYIYPLDSRRRGDQEGRARKTISGLRHCTAGGQRQSRQRADSSPILNLADRVPALRFRLCEQIHSRVKSLAADVCFFFLSHAISKGELKSQMCTQTG